MRESWTPKYRRLYRARNLENFQERERTWKRNNPEKAKANRKVDYERHREAYLMRAAQRRERLKLLKGTPTYDEFLRAQREAKWRAKMEVIGLFGGACQRCGFGDERALQLDHVNANPLPRETGLRGGEKLYRAILSGRISKDGFQILCANCNSIKRFENGEGCIKRDAPHPDQIPYRKMGWWKSPEERSAERRRSWATRRELHGENGRGVPNKPKPAPKPRNTDMTAAVAAWEEQSKEHRMEVGEQVNGLREKGMSYREVASVMGYNPGAHTWLAKLQKEFLNGRTMDTESRKSDAA